MRIASWNVNSLRVRLAQVLDWLQDNPVDVLALQETKLVDEDFPVEEIREAGYHAAYSGQKSYNGVAVLTRRPCSDTRTGIEGLEDPQKRILAVTVDDVRVLNLYVVNGSEEGSEKYAYKLEWLKKVTSFIKEDLQRFPRYVVLGDFNIAPQDQDVHDPGAWEGKILCSAPERKALNAMLELGLVDTFRLFEQEPGSFSWWDYRAAAFRRNRGLRIDLILASAPLEALCSFSAIDKTPRGHARPSDHAPVIAEFGG